VAATGLTLFVAICLLPLPLAAQEPVQGPAQKTGPGPPGTAVADAGRITGIEALEALVKNRTHYRRRSNGVFEVEFHSTAGISAYLWEGCVIYGKWWATPDEICFFYPESEIQGPHYFFIEEGGEGLEFWWSGDPLSPVPTATVVRDVEGNAENFPVGVSGECLVS